MQTLSVDSRLPAPESPIRLLALCTSGAWSSVAFLVEEGGLMRCDCIAEPSGAGQSSGLLGLVREVLGAQPVTGLSAVAFDAGPGAFTGLRIGCSVAQGIGLGAALALIPVGTHEAAAWQALRLRGGRSSLVLVVNDARIGQVYASLCHVVGASSAGGVPIVRRLAGPWLADQSSVPDEVRVARSRLIDDPVLAREPWMLAGNAWNLAGLSAEWRELAAPDAWHDTTDRVLDARAVAEVGVERLRRGEFVDAAQASPLYVRDKVALDLGEQRLARAQRAASR